MLPQEDELCVFVCVCVCVHVNGVLLTGYREHPVFLQVKEMPMGRVIGFFLNVASYIHIYIDIYIYICIDINIYIYIQPA